jgi:hypothetical protein
MRPVVNSGDAKPFVVKAIETLAIYQVTLVLNLNCCLMREFAPGIAVSVPDFPMNNLPLNVG